MTSIQATPNSVRPLLQMLAVSVRLPIGRSMRSIINEVSLEIREGESVGLVGESGAGKSMTARAIIRLLPADAEVDGQIWFEDRLITSMKRSELREFRAKRVAMIFQDPVAHTNPVRRIGDFVTEALRTNLGFSEAEARERAIALLTEVRIPNPERCLSQFPHELSGGLLQRVMIAAALAPNPRLLLADEPTTALDVTTQAEVMAILEGLRIDRGLAMLFITHDLNLAAATCDRTIVMYAGVIVEEQASALLHSDPLHPYSAGLVRSRPDVSESAAQLAAIPGRPLSSSEAPPGCVFTSRCEYVEAECRQARPPLREFAGGRVACRRAEELRGLLRKAREDA